MGAGASATDAAAITATSPVELTNALSILPPEVKAKLSAALAEKECKGRPQDDVSELRALVPHVLQALHANKMWESVKGAEDISCEKFKGDVKKHMYQEEIRVLRTLKVKAAISSCTETRFLNEKKHFSSDYYYSIIVLSLDLY